MTDTHRDASTVDVVAPLEGVSLTGNSARDVLADAAAWCARHEQDGEVLDVAWRIGGYETHGRAVKYQLRIYFQPSG